jgi:hypothetical protein
MSRYRKAVQTLRKEGFVSEQTNVQDVAVVDNTPKIQGLPLTLLFDPDTQQVHLVFKPEDYKTWEFVLATLGMATEKAKLVQQVNHAASMQQAMIQQQQAAQIAQSLRSPNGGRRY